MDGASADPQFEWDTAKDLANLERYGLSFDRAVRIFAGPTLEYAGRPDMAEGRAVAVGDADGKTLVVVYEHRGPVRRIVSVRPARATEREAFQRLFS